MADETSYHADDNLVATAVSLVTNGGTVSPKESRRLTMGLVLDLRERSIDNSRRLDALERSPFARPGKVFWALSVMGFATVSVLVAAVYTSELAIPFSKWLGGVLLKLAG